MSAGLFAALINKNRQGQIFDSQADGFEQCDLVIVEGDTRTDSLKIEVWREEQSSPPLAFEDKSIHAIVTDSLVPGDAEVWPRHDVATLAQRILHLARPEAS